MFFKRKKLINPNQLSSDTQHKVLSLQKKLTEARKEAAHLINLNVKANELNESLRNTGDIGVHAVTVAKDKSYNWLAGLNVISTAKSIDLSLRKVNSMISEENFDQTNEAAQELNVLKAEYKKQIKALPAIFDTKIEQKQKEVDDLEIQIKMHTEKRMSYGTFQ